jgi:hypothetical protein
LNARSNPPEFGLEVHREIGFKRPFPVQTPRRALAQGASRRHGYMLDKVAISSGSRAADMWCHALLAIRGARRPALTVNRNGRAGNAKRTCVPWWDDWNDRRPPCNRAIRCAVKSPVAT